MVVHEPARYVGLGWMAFGLAMYVVYRRADETSLLRARDGLAAGAARRARRASATTARCSCRCSAPSLDDDIVQTAALLVSGEPTDEAAIDTATIEAIWIFVMPMSLPLDASLPEAQLKHARQVLARAKAVGEEYTGVEVATATVRTRRAGYAIVDEARTARRRGDRARRRGTVDDPRRRAAGRPRRRSRATSGTSPSTSSARPSAA